MLGPLNLNKKNQAWVIEIPYMGNCPICITEKRQGSFLYLEFTPDKAITT